MRSMHGMWKLSFLAAVAVPAVTTAFAPSPLLGSQAYVHLSSSKLFSQDGDESNEGVLNKYSR